MGDVRMEMIFHVLVDERDDELLMAQSSARWLDVGGETTTSAAKDRVGEEESDEIGNGRRKRFAKLLVEAMKSIPFEFLVLRCAAHNISRCGKL